AITAVIVLPLADEPRKDGHTQRDDAADWLRELLADGPMPQIDVAAAAKENGISPATLRRARVKLGVKPRKEGFQKDARWIWSPPGPRNNEDAEDAQPPDVSTFDIFGVGEHLPDSDEPINDMLAEAAGGDDEMVAYAEAATGSLPAEF